ncbi:MAG: hypothetical protein AAGC96_09310 [Pseudomonadota bacterium]
MNMSTRVLSPLYKRRKQSIDPAKHFAVRVHNGYAEPMTREQFLDVVHQVSGTSRLLKKLAVASLRDMPQQFNSDNRIGKLAVAIEAKLADAKRMQSDFDALVRQLIFSDQHAFSLLEQTRTAMTEAIEAIHAALDKISRLPERNALPLTG